MSRFCLRPRWAVWLCLLWCLAASALALAQDKGVSGVLERSDAALYPEAVPRVLAEGK